jgi:hypothetical protein
MIRHISSPTWAAVTAAIVLNGFALTLGLYSVGLFDEAAHGFTTFAGTLFVAELLSSDLPRRAARYVVIVAALGLALGTLWEIGEWLYDRAVPVNAILGKEDTMSDLLWDATGAMLAALLKGVSVEPSRGPRYSNHRW